MAHDVGDGFAAHVHQLQDEQGTHRYGQAQAHGQPPGDFSAEHGGNHAEQKAGYNGKQGEIDGKAHFCPSFFSSRRASM